MEKIMECTNDDVRQICAWRYEAPYDRYNYPTYETIVKQRWTITEREKRMEEFRSVYKNNVLLGYFRVKKENGRLLLGLGMNPVYCGKGNGSGFLKEILSYIAKNYGSSVICMEVRTFNLRAIRCYEKAGFHVVDSYRKKTLIGEDEFVRMEQTV